MENQVAKIRQSDAMTIGQITEQELLEAENNLNMKLPASYRKIIKEFGVISAGSEEFFGLGVEGYLNIVETTLDERKLAKGDLEKYVVIQNIGMEGMLIVVSEDDQVYEYTSGNFKNLHSSSGDFVVKVVNEG